MEQFFNALQRAIHEGIGREDVVIDEDCGQLEALVNGEDQYPLTFPAVLIAAPDVKWENAGKAQRGEMNVRVRLAIDCYHDTRQGSGQENEIASRLQFAAKLNNLINWKLFDGIDREMKRIYSRTFSLPGGIKVYETEYNTIVSDNLE